MATKKDQKPEGAEEVEQAAEEVEQESEQAAPEKPAEIAQMSEDTAHGLLDQLRRFNDNMEQKIDSLFGGDKPAPAQKDPAAPGDAAPSLAPKAGPVTKPKRKRSIFKPLAFFPNDPDEEW